MYVSRDLRALLPIAEGSGLLHFIIIRFIATVLSASSPQLLAYVYVLMQIFIGSGKGLGGVNESPLSSMKNSHLWAT